MKPRLRIIFASFGGFLFLLFVVWWSGSFRGNSAPARLAVALVAVENNAGHPRARGPTVLYGITGLCAIFAVTNVAKDASIWFDTSAVEQRVGARWQRIAVLPSEARREIHYQGGKPWWGIASEDALVPFSPGTGYHFVVEWPREVRTNATWRLELRCGPTPSATARKWDDWLGLRLFSRRKTAENVYTPEVRQ